MIKQCAYVFLDRSRDWECAVTMNPSEFDSLEDWYCAGQVSSLKELFYLMEAYDFDAEYFYEYVDHCLSHQLFNMLNKDGDY